LMLWRYNCKQLLLLEGSFQSEQPAMRYFMLLTNIFSKMDFNRRKVLVYEVNSEIRLTTALFIVKPLLLKFCLVFTGVGFKKLQKLLTSSNCSPSIHDFFQFARNWILNTLLSCFMWKYNGCHEERY
jgi:hypothetical protein